MAYISLICGLFCTGLAVFEFARLKDTRQWNLFWKVFSAGLNLFFAARGFGWL